DSSATGLTNGTSANVSTNGGTSAYSSTTVSLGTSITPVNDQPVISGPPDQTGNSGLPFALPTFYTLSDKDAVNSPMQLSIKVTEGNSASGLDLSYQLRTGVTFLDVSTDKTYRFQGSLSDLQNWVKQANFASVTFYDAFNGQANVSLTLSDNGNDGGPVKSSSHTFNVAVSNTPVLADAYTSPDNTKIVLYFNEALNSTTAPASAFAISIAGVSVTATTVSVSGNSVVLTLPSQVVAGDAISVSYTAPPANNATSNAAIQDSSGNDATSFSTNVTNLRGDTSVPLLQSAELSEDAQRVILTFHEALAPTTAAPNMFTLSRPGGTSSALSSVKVVNKNSVLLALSAPVTPSDVLTVGYSAPSVNNTLNTNSAVQDMYGVDARSFNAYTVFSVPNMPVNQVNQKVFAAPVGSQIDITGLGVSDTYSTTTETPLQIALKVTSGNVQLLSTALTANGVTATGGSVSGGFRSGSSLTLTGTEAKLNTFLSTLGNVKYTAPSAFPASGAVLTMVSTVNDTAKYQDTDTVVFAPPNTTGLGLSIGSMPIRQGMNGSAIGIKSNSNLLTMALFDVVDTSLPAGMPSPTQLADYTINIAPGSGMGIKLQNSFFYKTAAPTTAVTSFTLAEVYNGNVGFYYSGAATLPTFTATVSKASITSAVASSNLQFLSGASAPELTGGVVYYGDGSGVGGTGGYSSGNGTNGVGDNDNFNGTETHDVIFG
ncbi:MAG: SwmB domain-containing protein, partial [Burkholderiales bacterium]